MVVPYSFPVPEYTVTVRIFSNSAHKCGASAHPLSNLVYASVQKKMQSMKASGEGQDALYDLLNEGLCSARVLEKSEKRATLITVVDIIQSPNLPLWVVTCAPNSSKMTSVSR